MGKKINEDVIRFVLEHINDRPRTLVASAVGISMASMYKIVHQFNGEINPNHNRSKGEIIERMKELYPTHSATECAKILGVCKSTAMRWAHRLGLSHNAETEQRITRQRNETLDRCRANIDFTKRAKTWKRRRKMDEIRVLSGQEQKTKFKIKFLPRRLYLAMYYLSRKYGYTVIDDLKCEMMRPPDWGEEKYFFVERHFGEKHKITFYDYVDKEGDSDDSI